MKKENVKVAIWGFGAMGSGIAKILIEKPGVEITGVCDIHPDRIGKSIFELLEIEKKQHRDIIIKEDFKKVIVKDIADIVLLSTDSFVKGAYNKIIYCLNQGLNVITTAEEMAYPKAQEPELSKKMDKIAKENNATVLGTGINPGLIMDLLVVMLSGACVDVESIKVSRINDLSPFGPAVMEGQGVGNSIKEFEERVKKNELDGHVGFPESIRMITDAIGWKLSKNVEIKKSPIVSSVRRKSPYAEVKKGDVAGCNMKGYGFVDDKIKIEMIHPQQIEPNLENIDTGDFIEIKGTPNINMSITPEIPGGIGTMAMVVNMIPQVINSSAGLKTMLDLPVPRAIMGDMRDFID